MKSKSVLAISLCLSIFLSLSIFPATTLSSGKTSEPQSKSPQGQIPKRITGKDGTPMVLIPAGEFQMGNRWEDAAENPNRGKGYFKDQQPIHTVYVDAFFMDIYEVTNEQYQKFLEAAKDWDHDWELSRYDKPYEVHKPDEFYDKPQYNQPNQPVVGLAWKSARDYCKWVGKRLPTEAEWEKAARGGLEGKRYPWGDSISPEQANYGHHVGKPTPVGSYPPENSYGLHDMMGNVSEWCADWYSPDYYQNSPYHNPPGASWGGAGDYRVARGGNTGLGSDWFSNASRTYSSQGVETNYGFRCAKSISR